MHTCPNCKKPLTPTEPKPPQTPYTEPARRGDYGPSAQLPPQMRYRYLPPKIPQFRFQCWHCGAWLRWRDNGEMRVVKKPPLCPECGDVAILRSGKHGQFYGCANYPKCKARVPQTPRLERVPDCSLVIADNQSAAGAKTIILNEVYDNALEREARKEFYKRKRGYYDA